MTSEAKATKARAEKSEPKKVSIERTQYWVGVTQDCPLQYVTVGSLTFPRFTEIVVDTEDEYMTRRSPSMGSVVNLNQDEVDEVLEKMEKYVVTYRGRGETRVAELRVRGAASHIPSSDDEPLTKYCYLLSLKEVMSKGDPFWRENRPKTISE